MIGHLEVFGCYVRKLIMQMPWLLVIISGSALFGSILALLFILQQAELYNGWDILFTGGFYFSKNKIFGTIGEAQAPSRGVLFASYGPVVALIAVACAFAVSVSLALHLSLSGKADDAIAGMKLVKVNICT